MSLEMILTDNIGKKKNFIANNSFYGKLFFIIGLVIGFTQTAYSNNFPIKQNITSVIEISEKKKLFTYKPNEDPCLELFNKRERNLKILFGASQYKTILEDYNNKLKSKFQKNLYLPRDVEFLFPLMLYPSEEEHKKYVKKDKNTIIIDLKKFILYFYERQELKLSTRCADASYGKKKLEAKHYTILKKIEKKRSIKYNNAPMPYSMQIYGDYFLHGGYVNNNGRISKGCIRIPLAFASYLFKMVNVGDNVIIIR